MPTDREGRPGRGAGRLRVGVLASGRGSNLQAIMDAIAAGRVPAQVVVVLSDKPGAAALERARAAGIPAEFVDPADFPTREAFDRRLAERLMAYGVDLVVLAGFMRILSPVFVRAFPGRIMNIHPSLLPAFPGLHAQRQALEHGVKVSGCTVHFVDEGLDSGPIILQAAVPVRDDDSEESLAARILEEEHRLYPEAVRLFAEGRLEVRGRRVYIKDHADAAGDDGL